MKVSNLPRPYFTGLHTLTGRRGAGLLAGRADVPVGLFPKPPSPGQTPRPQRGLAPEVTDAVRSHATPVHPGVARVHERSEGTRGCWLHRATPPAPPHTKAPHRSAASGSKTPVTRRQAPSGAFGFV